MSPRRSVLTAVAAGLVLCGVACHPAPPQRLFAGGALPFGEDIYLNPANYGWSFPAKPGETYRIRADWPNANVRLVVASDFRGPTGSDDDDAANTKKAEVEPAGKHGQQATLVIASDADTAFIELHTVGDGSGPMHLRIDRGP
jgi:hypothetical protein